MKKTILSILIVLAVLLSAIPLLACEMSFTLVSGGGDVTDIRPGKTVTVEKDEMYTLRVLFTPDHGNCLLEVEDTVYLLEDERWKVSKDHLPVVLVQSTPWEAAGDGRSWEQELTLSGREIGKWDLQIIRDCSKGGYDEVITFKVSEG